MIPTCDAETGYLPRGLHHMEWATFKTRFAWNYRRRFLSGGMYRALLNLRDAGCRASIIDGSYVSLKDEPDDYDAAFDPVGVNGALVDPILLRHSDGRAAMRAKYFGDLFPWGATACPNTGMIYQDFFQQDRSGLPKGVVFLDLKRLP
jgi:hypothetical protein